MVEDFKVWGLGSMGGDFGFKVWDHGWGFIRSMVGLGCMISGFRSSGADPHG